MAAAPHLPLTDRPASQDLPSLLHRIFGHRDFRPHQQPVCEAAAAGRDVLLVMPTGAGKSLCYQLPALARGGTALVISPLIALMDDQAGKLEALNLRVARIHSGLSRESSREAARAYLQGNLDFLFIAPERLRVPGFPEMLAKRKPALVAIDEAHCISQWGHDFRPDYRTLGQFLPALRPSPIIALTATATPAVQGDILRALSLQDPAVFITGFRRTNLHIEVVEVSKPQRLDAMRKLLAPEAARPAIVYAQSRKAAEELASDLGARFPAAPYHAGLDPATRDRVQRAFLTGQLDVVVATVAFGMGVDKADVRTVIHAALPGSVEAYYQEIGRAGRDGKPSRAVLLHSFADRRTQEFFLEKSYPPVADMERVLTAIQEGLTSLSDLQQTLKLDREVIEQSVDKLLVQGAISAHLDGAVTPAGASGWKAGYEQQIAYRRSQIDKIIAFAEGATCRMGALVQHFGDRNDSGRPCGVCDICHPQGAVASTRHQATAQDKQALRELLHAIPRDGRSLGKVFSELGWSSRPRFQAFVDALAQAGLVAVAQDSFRNAEGEMVSYGKLTVTAEGRDADDAALDTVYLKDTSAETENGTARRRKGTSGRGERRAPSAAASDVPLTDEQLGLEKKLKEWRSSTARANSIAPFLVLHDSVLRGIAQASPGNLKQLEAIRGMGQEKVNRYGADLLALCRGEAGAPAASPSLRRETAGSSAPRAAQAPFPKARPANPSREPDASPGVLTARERAAHAAATRLQAQAALPGFAAAVPDRPLNDAEQQLETRLRAWRAEQAGNAGLPSFFVLSDSALRQVILAQPQTLADLALLPGLGRTKVEQYGASLLALFRP